MPALLKTLQKRLFPVVTRVLYDSSRVYPLVITSHPSEPNQFALGLTDGGVYVLEPLESEGKWGTWPHPENSACLSKGAAKPAPDQTSR